ncbi:hypothetical protein cypCar_00045979 [Cyprinus carpio]|nr:hypothetical protein cypCar_00045979 [Cyprinus carpio]
MQRVLPSNLLKTVTHSSRFHKFHKKQQKQKNTQTHQICGHAQSLLAITSIQFWTLPWTETVYKCVVFLTGLE